MSFWKSMGLMALGTVAGIAIAGTKKFKEFKAKAEEKIDEYKAKCDEQKAVDEIVADITANDENKTEK